MGSSSSSQRAAVDFRLPRQQVVAVGAGFVASAAAGGQVQEASVAAEQATKCNADQVKVPVVWSGVSVQRASTSSRQKHLWRLQVGFTADVPCELEVHFFCTERAGVDGLDFVPANAKAKPSRPSIRQSYHAGKHIFSLEGPQAIDLQRWPLHVYWKRTVGDVLPIVLSLRAPGVSGVQSLQYVALSQDAGELSCQVFMQKVVLQGKEYVMQEIYGLADLGDGQHDESSMGEPCVICLEESRTTAMLPCRHLCTCAACAGATRARGDHCPICRGTVTGLQTFALRK